MQGSYSPPVKSSNHLQGMPSLSATKTPEKKSTSIDVAAAASSTFAYLSDLTINTFTTLSQVTRMGNLGMRILYKKIAGDHGHIIPFNHTAVLMSLAITPTSHKLSFRCPEQEDFVEFDTDSFENGEKRTLKGASRDETVRVIREALETQNHFLNTDPCIKLLMSLAKIGMSHLSKAYEKKKFNETSDPIKKNIMEQVLDIFQNQLTRSASSSVHVDSDPVWTAASFFKAIYLIKSCHFNSCDEAIKAIFFTFETEISSIQSDLSQPFSLNNPSLSFTAEQIKTLQSPPANVLQPTVQLIHLLTSVQALFENLQGNIEEIPLEEAPLEITNPHTPEQNSFSVTPSSPTPESFDRSLLNESLSEVDPELTQKKTPNSNEVVPDLEEDPLMFHLEDLEGTL